MNWASGDVPLALAVAARVDGDVAAEVQHERLQRPARGHRRQHPPGAKTAELQNIANIFQVEMLNLLFQVATRSRKRYPT